MIRQLLCPKCGLRPTLVSAEDVVEGWKFRKVLGVAHKPKDLHITVRTESKVTNIDVDVLCCDLCNAAIPDGSDAYALTMWRDEPEPEQWEDEYLDLTNK